MLVFMLYALIDSIVLALMIFINIAMSMKSRLHGDGGDLGQGRLGPPHLSCLIIDQSEHRC